MVRLVLGKRILCWYTLFCNNTSLFIYLLLLLLLLLLLFWKLLWLLVFWLWLLINYLFYIIVNNDNLSIKIDIGPWFRRLRNRWWSRWSRSYSSNDAGHFILKHFKIDMSYYVKRMPVLLVFRAVYVTFWSHVFPSTLSQPCVFLSTLSAVCYSQPCVSLSRVCFSPHSLSRVCFSQPCVSLSRVFLSAVCFSQHRVLPAACVSLSHVCFSQALFDRVASKVCYDIAVI